MTLRKPLLLTLTSLALASCGGSSPTESTISSDGTLVSSDDSSLSSIDSTLTSEEGPTTYDYIEALLYAENAMRTRVDELTYTKHTVNSYDGEIEEDTYTMAISRQARKGYYEDKHHTNFFVPSAYNGYDVSYSVEKDGGGSSVYASYAGSKNIADFDPLDIALAEQFPYFVSDLYSYVEDYFTFYLAMGLLEYDAFDTDEDPHDFSYEVSYALAGDTLENGYSFIAESSIKATSKSNSRRELTLSMSDTFLYTSSFISSIETKYSIENRHSALLVEKATITETHTYTRGFDLDKFNAAYDRVKTVTPWGGDIDLQFKHAGLSIHLSYNYESLNQEKTEAELIADINDNLEQSNADYRVTALYEIDGERLESVTLDTTDWLYYEFAMAVNNGKAYVCHSYEDPLEFDILFEEEETAIEHLMAIDGAFTSYYDKKGSFVDAGDQVNLSYTYDGREYAHAYINGREASEDYFIAANRGDYEIVYTGPVAI